MPYSFNEVMDSYGQTMVDAIWNWFCGAFHCHLHNDQERELMFKCGECYELSLY
jgi:hypothetical protein